MRPPLPFRGFLLVWPGQTWTEFRGKERLPLNLEPGSFLKSFPLDELAAVGFCLWCVCRVVPIDTTTTLGCSLLFFLRKKKILLSFFPVSSSSEFWARPRSGMKKEEGSVGRKRSMFGRGVWNVSVRTLDRFVYFQRQSRFSDSMIGPPRLIAIVGSLNFPLL